MVAQQIKKFATYMDPEKLSPDSTSYAIPSQFNQSYFPQTILILCIYLLLCMSSNFKILGARRVTWTKLRIEVKDKEGMFTL
jgi:hypothetical protein